MKKLLLLCSVCLITFLVTAQSRTVTGRVTSEEDGSPVPGVNVLLKGTSSGTVTDADGNYSIGVNSNNDILVFSFVGLVTKEVSVGASGTVDVQLTSDARQLGEVVVVAYGETDARKLTGSVGTVASKQLEQVPIPSFDNMLQGQSAGVYVTPNSGQPGGATSVRVRGIGSITAGSAPLYVVDGVPVNIGDLTRSQQTANVLSTFNPNDIESISVLKDASATSIYGSRGANGVVLITTKKGKNGKTVMNFRTSHGISDWENPSNFRVMNGSEYLELHREAVVNGGGDPDNPAVSATYFPAGSDTISTDWLSMAFQQGKTSTYEVTAQGGDNKTRFFASAALFDQEGLAVATDFRRITTRVNVDHNATDKLNFGLNIGLSNSKMHGRYGGGTSFGDPIYGGLYLSPLYPVYATPEQIASGEDRGTGFNFNTPGFSNHNIAATLALASNESVTNRVTGKIFGSYEIVKDLIFTTSLGLDLVEIRENEWTSQNHPDGVNSAGSALSISTNNTDVIALNTLGYSRSFGNHAISALFGNEFQKSSRESVDATGTGFPSDKLRTVDAASTPNDVGAFYTESAIWGIFGKVNYAYNDKAFADVSFRRDGSSRFGVNNRYATFYSVGLGYLLSEESFISNIEFINTLKIRGSYGTSGNQDIGNFDAKSLYSFGGFTYNTIEGSYSGSGPNSLGNPDLRWEKANTFDVGIDFGVLKNRLSGTIEYYNKKASDMLLDVPVSRTSGFSTILKNIGEMVNKGVEVSLNTINLETSGFRWESSLNVSFNKNEVTNLPDGQDIVGGTTIIREGEVVNSWYIPRYAGVDPGNGRPLWYDENGNIVTSYGEADRVIVGSNLPDYYGGFTNTFTYKGLSLSVFFYYNHGNLIYRNISQFITADGTRFGRNQDAVALQRWQNPGDVTSVPRVVRNNTDQGNSFSTRYLEDGSFVKLRNVALSYSLPTSIISRAKLSGVRVYFMGSNLKTWTEYRGPDPEVGQASVDFGDYPIPRTYTFGVDVTF